MLDKKEVPKTLSPDRVCRLTTTETSERIFLLPAGVGAYGITSGAVYMPGRNKPEKTDVGNRIMLFWKEPRVDVETSFLGRVPTREHMYGAEARLSFTVAEPAWFYQSFLGSGEELTLVDFSQAVSQHVRKLLLRLASRYSPEAMVQGAARDAATNDLSEGLNSIYADRGIGVQRVQLVDVTQRVRERQADHIEKLIAFEAQERDIDLGVARADLLKRLDVAAGEGDEDARRTRTILAVVGREDLKKKPAGDREVHTDQKACRAQLEVEPVLIGGAQKASGRFAVLRNDEAPCYYEILRSWFCIGRHENCEVPVSAPGVSSIHFTVARVGSGLTLTDHNTTFGTIYNGERICQRFVESGDVFRIGDAWVVFKLEPGQEFRQVDHRARGSMRMDGGTMRPARFKKGGNSRDRKAMDDESALVELASSAGRFASSDSRPILIGHDSICDLRLGGGGVGRFHAVVCWDAEIDEQGKVKEAGVFVEDLYSGRGTKLNGQPVHGAALSDGDLVEIGGHRITVSFTGNIERRARALAAVTPEPGKLAMTCIEGADEGTALTLEPDTDDVIIGRDEDATLKLTSEEVSGLHARIASEMVDVGGGNYHAAFFIEDLNSTNGTSVNRHQLKPGENHKIGPGDIVRLGRGGEHCDLMVHYAGDGVVLNSK